jgi:uncharacterized membrane protein
MTRMLKTVLVLAALSVPLSACVGRSGKQTTNVKTTTVGQELSDLDAAYKSGLLTEDEYNKKRKDILKKG